MSGSAAPPGAANAFSGARLDRASAARSDEHWVAARRRDPDARAIAVAEDGVLVADEPRLAAVRLALDAVAGRGAGEPLLLGLEDGRPLFAADLGEDRDPATIDRLAPTARVLGLREAGALLPQAEGGLVAYASALLGWHRRNPHCSVCGAATEIAEAGLLRRCPRCGAVHHPRTDPVVIMLVADAERVLLGRQPTWPEGRYSALAGFVEPGENLEAAVAREVWEESGVEVSDPRYRSSQPWPFPGSLMLGFVAAYAGGEPSVRDGELDDVRWFSREAVAAAAAGRGAIELPPPVAIARRLIDGWLGEQAP